MTSGGWRGLRLCLTCAPLLVQRMHLATMSTIMRLMHNREQPAEAAVMVCHSVPTAWRLPEPLWHTPPCPPADGPPSTYTVGRCAAPGLQHVPSSLRQRVVYDSPYTS